MVNTYAGAVEAGAFTAYTPSDLPGSAEEHALPDGGAAYLTPVGFGDVCVNVDNVWFANNGLVPPQTLRDLTEPEYEDLFVTPGATTSSPGMAFLLATVGEFGPTEWQGYWEDPMANGDMVTSGWTDADTVDFTAGGGGGDRPTVLSYASGFHPGGEARPSGRIREGLSGEAGGAYLRRESLYSSLVVEWRRLRDADVLGGKRPVQKVGRLTQDQAEIARLRQRLEVTEGGWPLLRNVTFAAFHGDQRDLRAHRCGAPGREEAPAQARTTKVPLALQGPAACRSPAGGLHRHRRRSDFSPSSRAASRPAGASSQPHGLQALEAIAVVEQRLPAGVRSIRLG